MYTSGYTHVCEEADPCLSCPPTPSFFCLDTLALSYFAIYLKTLGTYTVQQINL